MKFLFSLFLLTVTTNTFAAERTLYQAEVIQHEEANSCIAPYTPSVIRYITIETDSEEEAIEYFQNELCPLVEVQELKVDVTCYESLMTNDGIFHSRIQDEKHKPVIVYAIKLVKRVLFGLKAPEEYTELGFMCPGFS